MLGLWLHVVGLLVAVLFLLPRSPRGDPIPVPQEGQEKVCYVNTVTLYDDPSLYYRRFRGHYADCTHVVGVLHIAYLDSRDINYDLSFLNKIRYVSGNVAIFANDFPATVSLPSLEVIRGNLTFRDEPIKGLNDITLLIGANNHQHIYMPKLKEVSSGNVLLDLETCPNLCHLNTIDWATIVREGTVQRSINNIICSSCSPACEWQGRGRHCWGPTADLCQAQKAECSDQCQHGLCVAGHPDQCCSPVCAIGCHGPSPTQCTMCRDYIMEDGRCSSFCPLHPLHLVQGQNCTRAQ